MAKCTRCRAKEATSGFRLCEACRKQKREYRIRQIKSWDSRNKCVYCGGPRDHGYKRCEGCREYLRELNRTLGFRKKCVILSEEALPTEFEPGSPPKIDLLRRRNEMGFKDLHVIGDAMSQHAAERLAAFANADAAGIWD